MAIINFNLLIQHRLNMLINYKLVNTTLQCNAASRSILITNIKKLLPTFILMDQIIKPKEAIILQRRSLSTEIILLLAEGRGPEADNLMIKVNNDLLWRIIA